MTTLQVPQGHLWLAVSTVMVAHIFETLPRSVVLGTATGAPLATLGAGALALLLAWPVLAMLSRRPGQNLVDLALTGLGRPFAVALALIISTLLIGAAGLSLRMVSEMAITAMFPHTPETFLMSTLLVSGALGAAMEPASLLWIGALLLGPFLLGLTAILLGNFAWGTVAELLPVAGHGALTEARSAIAMSSYFGELVFLMVLSRHVTAPEKLVRSGIKVALTVTLTWGAVILIYLMVFPYPGGLSIPFPVFEMTRLVQGGRYLERMDGLWVLVSTLGSAARLASFLLVAAVLLRDAFRLPDHRMAVLPLAAATLGAALFPSNLAGTIQGGGTWIYKWGFLITLILPLLAAALAALRREKKRHGA